MSSSFSLILILHYIVWIICLFFLTLSPGLMSVVLNNRNTDIIVTHEDQRYILYKTKFTRFQAEYVNCGEKKYSHHIFTVIWSLLSPAAAQCGRRHKVKVPRKNKYKKSTSKSELACNDSPNTLGQLQLMVYCLLFRFNLASAVL